MQSLVRTKHRSDSNFACLLALFLLGCGDGTNDPTQEGQFPMTIPVETVGLDDEKMAYDHRARASACWTATRRSRFGIPLQPMISALTSICRMWRRVHLTLPIQFEARVNPDTTPGAHSPKEATLTVEFIAEKELTVTVKSVGDAGLRVPGGSAGGPSADSARARSSFSGGESNTGAGVGRSRRAVERRSKRS